MGIVGPLQAHVLQLDLAHGVSLAFVRDYVPNIKGMGEEEEESILKHLHLERLSYFCMLCYQVFWMVCIAAPLSNVRACHHGS